MGTELANPNWPNQQRNNAGQWTAQQKQQAAKAKAAAAGASKATKKAAILRQIGSLKVAYVNLNAKYSALTKRLGGVKANPTKAKGTTATSSAGSAKATAAKSASLTSTSGTKATITPAQATAWANGIPAGQLNAARTRIQSQMKSITTQIKVLATQYQKL